MFGMEQITFSNYQKWKRQAAKKKVGLFERKNDIVYFGLSKIY
jgi:hypothetical protein